MYVHVNIVYSLYVGICDIFYYYSISKHIFNIVFKLVYKNIH